MDVMIVNEKIAVDFFLFDGNNFYADRLHRNSVLYVCYCFALGEHNHYRRNPLFKYVVVAVAVVVAAAGSGATAAGGCGIGDGNRNRDIDNVFKKRIIFSQY